MQRTARTVGAAEGRVLCFAEWGEPDGRAVFSLHGTPGCRLLGARRLQFRFEDLLHRLGIRLITYDRPGWGGSDRLAGRVVADCAADVAAIADVLGIESFAIEGSSSGAHHALAVSAMLPDRVQRTACVAPMAPYTELGHDAWSRGQDDEVLTYVSWCLEGESRMLAEFAREDAQMRKAATEGDTADAEIFEQTRNGLWGWVDDERSAFEPWGFNPAEIGRPIVVWYNPNDPVLPPQHAEWYGRTVPGAELVATTTLGHGASGDPQSDWVRLYSWLAGVHG